MLCLTCKVPPALVGGCTFLFISFCSSVLSCHLYNDVTLLLCLLSFAFLLERVVYKCGACIAYVDEDFGQGCPFAAIAGPAHCCSVVF